MRGETPSGNETRGKNVATSVSDTTTAVSDTGIVGDTNDEPRAPNSILESVVNETHNPLVVDTASNRSFGSSNPLLDLDALDRAVAIAFKSIHSRNFDISHLPSLINIEACGPAFPMNILSALVPEFQG